MINPSEHVYDDDPNLGHPDVRTRLKDVSYFFLGNGHIQAAVQWAAGGEGTPLGLLLMDPDRLRKKREALTGNVVSGLGSTLVRVETGGAAHQARAGSTRASWVTHDGVPAVEAVWTWEGGQVTELFFCADPDTPRLVREVRVRSSNATGTVRVSTGAGGRRAAVSIGTSGEPACFVYQIVPGSNRVDLRTGSTPVSAGARARWERASRFTFSDPLLDRFARLSQYQLAAARSASGRIDSSIWQYNREWVRDQALVAVGFLMAGDRDGAACVLGRLLREFITPEGGAMDSSEVRGPDEAELDQNGVLLHALEQYVRWTGDISIVAEHWPRIEAAADTRCARSSRTGEPGCCRTHASSGNGIGSTASSRGSNSPTRSSCRSGSRRPRAWRSGCASPGRRRAGRHRPNAFARRHSVIPPTGSSPAGR